MSKSVCYRYEWVRCGKTRCRRCPHGPYWYAYWWEAGRTRKRYIGRKLDQAERFAAQADNIDLELVRSLAELHDHWRRDRASAQSFHRYLVKMYHPDRGGSVAAMAKVNALWDSLNGKK